MKNTFLFLALLAFVSCQKDPQEDLCKGIICLNGGVCINGDCECPPQYTGPACGQEKPPIKMRAASIRITSFPATAANGAGWDFLDGPDVYLVISQGSTVLLTTAFVTNLTSQYEWNVNFEFSNPTATYTITALDDDGLLNPDVLGGISFTPYLSGANFPTATTLSCASCTVSFNLTGLVYSH